MLRRDMTKSEIEEEIKRWGEYVQIDNLTRFLNQDLPMEIRKFVCLKLSEIYEKKGLFHEAGKMYNNAAMIVIPFAEKIKLHLKEAELYIKAGDFLKVDEAMKKAVANSTAKDGLEIYSTVKELYKKQAEAYEKSKRRNQALRIYEKLLEIRMSDEERQEIKKKLTESYEKLGKFKEYFAMKKQGEVPNKSGKNVILG